MTMVVWCFVCVKRGGLLAKGCFLLAILVSTVVNMVPSVTKMAPTVMKMVPTVMKMVPTVIKIEPSVSRFVPSEWKNWGGNGLSESTAFCKSRRDLYKPRRDSYKSQ